MRVNHIDLFSGIGGFSLAAQQVWKDNHEILAFCEIDPFCQKVLRKHWPDVPIHDDIKTLTKEVIDEMGQRRNEKYNIAVAMYESGLSVAECANHFGISRQAMHKILQRRGVRFRPNRRYGEDNHFYRGGSKSAKYAQHKVEKAIKAGLLKPKSCEVCGDKGVFKDGRSSIQAHHDNYNKPLEVRWLCQRCHHEWHKNNTAKERRQAGANSGADVTILTGGFPC